MTEPQKKPRKKTKTALAAALVALAVWFGWCGRGMFLGDGSTLGTDRAEDKASEPETAVAPSADAAPARCRLRVDAEGIALADERVEIERAIEACKVAGTADLTVTGDARFGTADELRQGLEAAGVRVFSAGRPAAEPEPTAP